MKRLMPSLLRSWGAKLTYRLVPAPWICLTCGVVNEVTRHWCDCCGFEQSFINVTVVLDIPGHKDFVIMSGYTGGYARFPEIVTVIKT